MSGSRFADPIRRSRSAPEGTRTPPILVARVVLRRHAMTDAIEPQYFFDRVRNE
jgi:hypothetical protein